MTTPTRNFGHAYGETIGPLLYLQGADGDHVHLAALVVSAASARPPELRTEFGPAPATTVIERGGMRVHRYVFTLPMRPEAWYEVGGQRYTVDTAFHGDLRLAFVSCNGQESGDRGRGRDERNAMWARLAAEHDARPFQLLIHGGDQIYADELLEIHPLVSRWAESKYGGETATAATLDEVSAALRTGFFERYLDVLSQPETAALMARIPSLAMWDDHDICDGWGSMPTTKLDSPVGKCLLAAARECFLLFQLGTDPEQIPDMCVDRSGTSFGWRISLPELHLVAPDLRSQRRPNQVMGEAGHQSLAQSLDAIESGRILLLSTVPALGPRLSWVEAVLHLLPGLQKYEDDLRDQWQSRAHRAEWRRFLKQLQTRHSDPATPITLLSGEIHLATRATFDVSPVPIHQLVASGIAHPAPALAYAGALDALARFGETPLPGHPIRLHPLPGAQGIYTAERNYLVLERRDSAWTAAWELERGGRTPALPI